MSDARHKCPVHLCTSSLPYHLLMCSAHWGQVPRELQRAVTTTWNRCAGDFTEPDYVKARTAAIDAVNNRAPAAPVSDLPTSKFGRATNRATCPCGDPILWVRTFKNDRPMPINDDGTDTPHHATCAQVERWRGA